MADPTLALMVGRAVSVRRANITLAAIFCVNTVLAWVMMVGSGRPELWSVMYGVLVPPIVIGIYLLNRPSRAWLRHGRALLAREQWRMAEAAVARPGNPLRSTLVDLVGDGGRRTVVVRLRPGHERMIARAGRAWLIEDSRTVLLRVDGSHAAFGARNVAVTERRVAADTGDQFTPSGLEMRRLRRKVVSTVAGMALASCVYALLGWIFDDFLLVVGALFVPLIVIGYYVVVSMTPACKVAVNASASQWTWVFAILDPWDARSDWSAKARGLATLADGTRLRVDLPVATPDMLGAIWETGGMWVAGTPAPGRTLAAGYPDAPLAAAVRFRRVSSARR